MRILQIYSYLIKITSASPKLRIIEFYHVIKKLKTKVINHSQNKNNETHIRIENLSTKTKVKPRPLGKVCKDEMNSKGCIRNQ